jgi:hypothetical protein
VTSGLGEHHDGGTVAKQSVGQMGGRTSIVARQRADHERRDRLIAQARATHDSGGAAHAKTLRALTRLVFTHAFAEEAVLFPAARRVLPEGDPMTLHIESAHQEVDELVTRLDRSCAHDPGHAALLEQTFTVLNEPLPWQATCAPGPRCTSARVIPGQLGDPQPGLPGRAAAARGHAARSRSSSRSRRAERRPRPP